MSGSGAGMNIPPGHPERDVPWLDFAAKFIALCDVARELNGELKTRAEAGDFDWDLYNRVDGLLVQLREMRPEMDAIVAFKQIMNEEGDLG